MSFYNELHAGNIPGTSGGRKLIVEQYDDGSTYVYDEDLAHHAAIGHVATKTLGDLQHDCELKPGDKLIFDLPPEQPERKAGDLSGIQPHSKGPEYPWVHTYFEREENSRKVAGHYWIHPDGRKTQERKFDDRLSGSSRSRWWKITYELSLCDVRELIEQGA